MICGSAPSHEYPTRTRGAPAATKREKSQIYAQRYIPHLLAAGAVVIFERSCYNRAGIEREMGFCTNEQTERFLQMIPTLENAIVDDCIIRLKYWLDIIPDKQTHRSKRASMTGVRSGSCPTWI